MNKKGLENSRNGKRSGGKVLIIDDTPSDLRVLVDLLVRNGYQVRPSLNVDLALKYLESELPDLILLDIRMPGMDGYEFCQLLKSEDRTWNIPVIFISALDNALDKVHAFDSGGVDYITKPFHNEEILVRVRTHIDLHRMQKVVQDQNERLKNEIDERRRVEDEIRQVNELLDMRIEQRTAELCFEKEQADITNLIRRYFLDNMSEELTASVHSILSLSHDFALQQASDLSPVQQAYIQELIDKAEQLLFVIDDLHKLAKWNTRHMDLDLKEVSIRQILENTLTIVRSRYGKGDLEFDLIITEALDQCRMLVDERKVKVILFNLLTNAVTHSPPGGRVIVEAFIENRHLSISVSDMGTGIEPEDQQLLFIDSSQTSGPGWGLAICRRLAEVHQGKIEVFSEGKGRGSRFTLTIPLHYV